MTLRNAFWSYFSMFSTIAIRFVSRTVFIHFLGKDYLGINGLFSSVLGVLSFAELGIGTAMNFSLYRPVAQGDTEKIKSYMYSYKIAYRAIAGVILVLGLLLIPFLDILVNDPGNVGNITVYYLVFLFNTVSSYFVSYKFALVNAEQKNYVYTNINLIISVLTTLVQIITLFFWQNYLVYLLIAAVVGLLQKIFISRYLNRMYPYLLDTQIEPLTKEEKNTLIAKVKALVIHKLGEISVHQTDNIIISAFMNVGTVGLISNYNLLISTVSSCINVLFSSVTGSLGNLVATESPEKQYEVFRVYRFVGFWFYGFTSVALMVLLTPFITLWIGESMTVSEIVIALILLDYYMIGHRICITNVKTAGGVFEQDRYIALIQAVVNLISSIILIKLIGLPGVYIGTILQGIISSVSKPIIVYKHLFHISSKPYFVDSAKYGIAVLIALAVCWYIRQIVLVEITVLRFTLTMVLTAIIPNIVFLLFFNRREEFKYIHGLFRKILKR